MFETGRIGNGPCVVRTDWEGTGRNNGKGTCVGEGTCTAEGLAGAPKFAVALAVKEGLLRVVALFSNLSAFLLALLAFVLLVFPFPFSPRLGLVASFLFLLISAFPTSAFPSPAFVAVGVRAIHYEVLLKAFATVPCANCRVDVLFLRTRLFATLFVGTKRLPRLREAARVFLILELNVGELQE